jgi:hypothetical protein
LPLGTLLLLFAEIPSVDAARMEKMYSQRILVNPPQEGTSDHAELINFTSEVKFILHTANKKEYQAVFSYMKPPVNSPSVIENFPKPAMAVGTFGKMKAALIQTSSGMKSREELEGALKSFPFALYIISLGTCYAFDNKKYKLGDVLVSTTIIDFTYGVGNPIALDVDDFLFEVFCSDLIHNPTFEVTKKRESKVYCGQFLSHPIQMDDIKECDIFRAAAPDAIGSEMEGAMLMQLAKEENSLKGIIIIRGVFGYPDCGKKLWQFTAALAAAHYAQLKLSADISR